MILGANLSSYLSFITTLTVIVNPVGAAPLFIGRTEGARPAERTGIATTACITAGVALIISIVFGQSVLSLLGVRLPAFRVEGGIILLLMGVAML
jgi:multiple antibiotic resistance protein